MEGLMLALLGAAISAGLAGAGSAWGCAITGQSAAGVVTEEPDKFVLVLLLQALPGTQGFYGLVGLFLVMGKVASAVPTVAQGWEILFACLPVGLTGLISAIYQGKVCAAGCSIVAKRPEEFAKAMIFGVVVETYAVLGLLATILLLTQVKVGG